MAIAWFDHAGLHPRSGRVERSFAMEIHSDGFLGPRLRIIQFWTSRNLAQLFIRFHSRLISYATRRAAFSFPPICHTLSGRPVLRAIRRCEWPFDQEATGKLFIATCRAGLAATRVFLNVSCTRQRRVLSLRENISFTLGCSSISEDSPRLLTRRLWNLPKYSIDNRIGSRRSLERGIIGRLTIVFLWSTACNTRFVINY